MRTITRSLLWTARGLGALLMGDYGALDLTGGVTTLTLTNQNQWYQITLFNSNGISSGATPDHTSDDITIQTNGDYLIFVDGSFDGTANTTYEMAAFKNNGATQINGAKAERETDAGNDVIGIAAMGLDTLTKGDTVEMWVRCTSGANNDFTPSELELIVLQIG